MQSNSDLLLIAHKNGEDVPLEIYLDCLEEEGKQPSWEWRKVDFDDYECHKADSLGLRLLVGWYWPRTSPRQGGEGAWFAGGAQFDGKCTPSQSEAKAYVEQALWTEIGRKGPKA